MMGVFSCHLADMQIHANTACQSHKELTDYFCLHGSQSLSLQIGLKVKIHSAGKIQTGKYQRIIHRKNEVTKTGNACLVSQRTEKCLSQYNAGIFHGMVCIYLCVTFYLNCQIK